MSSASDHRYKALVYVKMTGPVIFHQSECCIRGRTRMMKKTVVSFQTLIISSTPQVNLSPTRPKSSRGRRKARPAAQVTRAYSQAKLTSISRLSPPTCALACSSKACCIPVSVLRPVLSTQPNLSLSFQALPGLKPNQKRSKNVQKIRCETFPDLQVVCLF